MHGPVVEGIVAAVVLRTPVPRHGEIAQVRQGLPHLPRLVVRLVVAEQRRHGDAVGDAVHRLKPSAPLPVILPVVDEVAHVDEKRRLRHARRRVLRQVTPIRVIVRLRVGEDERGKRPTTVRLKHVPIARLAARGHTILLRTAGRQPHDLRRVEIRRHAVIREGLLLGGEVLTVPCTARELHHRRGELHGRLPHDRPRRGIVARHHLPQRLDLVPAEHRRRLIPHLWQDETARKRPAAPAQQRHTSAKLQELPP